MFTRADLPDTGTMSVHYGDTEVLSDVPLDHVSVLNDDDYHAVQVGDDHGMKVASMPFTDATRETDHMWRFTGPDADFYITIEPEEQ
jgi:hypothetical protein